MEKHLLKAIILVFVTNLVSAQSVDPSNQFVNALINYLNSNPNNEYDFQDGILIYANQKSDYVYNIEANVKAVLSQDANKFKLLKCHGQVTVDTGTVLVVDQSTGCFEEVPVRPQINENQESEQTSSFEDAPESTPQPEEAVHVSLVHEVQPTNQATSGEQFVAVRRDGPGNPCSSGCSSPVDVKAPGVQDLATLAIRHIDRHEQGVKHLLGRIVSVERQVQVVNGVRYILLLDVDYDACSDSVFDSCISRKTCKVSILEKPWVRLPDGSKFRAILSNNCTAEYLFGDNGEVLPSIPEEVSTDPTTGEKIVQKVSNADSQAFQQNKDRELTSQEMKDLEKQIIPHNRFEDNETFDNTIVPEIVDESTYINNEIFAEPMTEKTFKKDEASINLSQDKKDALEGLDKLFDDSPQIVQLKRVERTKRDALSTQYEQDMAQLLMDTLNRFEFENKKRNLVSVLESDREMYNGKVFQYIRVLAVITECAEKENVDDCKHVKRKYDVNCGGMIDVTTEGRERVLKASCSPRQGRKMLKEKIAKSKKDVVDQLFDQIKADYNTLSDMKVNLVVKDINSEGTLKVKMEIGYHICPSSPTKPCSSPVSSTMVCEAKIKDTVTPKFVYSCQDILPNNKDVSFGGTQELNANDPRINEYVTKSLQKLESLSSSNYRQKVIQVHSADVQTVAGKLTKLVFDVGYTKCPKGEEMKNLDQCELVKSDWVRHCKAEIWERPWSANGTEIKTTCKEDFDIDSNLGATTNVDTEDSEVIDLAKEALHKFELLSSAKNKHKLLKVKSVKKQVVSGTLTIIEFDAGESECSITSANDIDACEISDDALLKMCTARIWSRPWLLNGNDIDVECTTEPSVKVKRSVLGLPGGATDANPDDPEIATFASEALNHYEKLTGTLNNHRIVKIGSASKQVVSGILIKIDFDVIDNRENISIEEALLDDSLVKHCKAEIWSRPWLENDKDIKVECVENEKKRTKRNLPGGPRDVDLNDPEILDLAKESLGHYESLSGAENTHTMTKILSAKKQIVAGTLTTIEFEVLQNLCKKSNSINTECDSSDSVTKKCTSEIWNRPWLNNGKQIDVKCDEIHAVSKRSLGGAKELDVNDPEVLNTAKEALHHYEKLSSAPNKHEIVRIISANTKTVAGKLTTIKFEVTETSCPRNQVTPNGGACAAQGSVKECTAEIWTRPWLQNGKDIKTECSPRSKRSVQSKNLLGDNEKLEDHKDEKFMKLAEEALLHADYNSVGKIRRKIISVDKASSKVVNGKITNLDVTVGNVMCNNDDKIERCELLIGASFVKCHLEIWEKGWSSSKRQISMNCDNPTENYSDSNLDDSANQLAELALRHIEAKYPHVNKLKVVKIISFDKEIYQNEQRLFRLKIEVGVTDCFTYSIKDVCEISTFKDEKRVCKASVLLESNMDEVSSVKVSCVMANEVPFGDIEVKSIARHVQALRLFQQFLLDNPRPYLNDDDEYLSRFTIFKENIGKIVELNTKEMGTAKYGVTKFADLTYEEFSKKHLGLRPDLKKENNIPMSKAIIPEVSLPGAFDWRDKGAVTPVKNQGACGSCWAFSVTGNVEGQWKIQKGDLISLSEQELVDCDKLDEGCNGGLPDNAYRAIENLGGLETENDYPYDAADEKCHFNKTLSRVTIKGAVNITSNETDMQKWLVKNGPISIGINANAMQFYFGGVSHPYKFLCSPKNLDHGVLIVGYGVKNYPLFHKTLPFWTIKNSWGEGWGEQGYYRVYRGDGTCGVNQMASSALV